MTIWQVCEGQKQFQHVEGSLYRIVESQVQVATRAYSDSLFEQELLEELIEDSKPPNPEVANNLNYLLTTPFRYPPLEWGSRFGSADELGIFYGTHSVYTTLAECAYYRLLFRNSIRFTDTDETIRTEHTLFSIDYISDKGIKLHESPFNKFRLELTDPINYAQTQNIGNAMRGSGVEVFEYESARDPKKGTCAGLFSSKAFKQNLPKSQSQWFCDTNAHSVTFKGTQRTGKTSVFTFSIQQFLVNGRLPVPSAYIPQANDIVSTPDQIASHESILG